MSRLSEIKEARARGYSYGQIAIGRGGDETRRSIWRALHRARPARMCGYSGRKRGTGRYARRKG